MWHSLPGLFKQSIRPVQYICNSLALAFVLVEWFKSSNSPVGNYSWAIAYINPRDRTSAWAIAYICSCSMDAMSVRHHSVELVLLASIRSIHWIAPAFFFLEMDNKFH